ncbi:VWA domain-containing protein [Aestuariicoccus sp. MJ-SS9]|uniref:vWA domain-containing protein n=1 Tax=Aestuariicoccus sp. MJ-SS9 TaxID=3079855 RepID=UPI002912069C|nr:VWA domain-containing protein [Aestuariicoccus sp. MJ-SS9]MDU8913975.1 VWA domain-containing protein [Aestuariicoccus sp. MJ-SS9]
MSELDDLKTLIDKATPTPDAAKKAQHLALAQENFEAFQGSRGRSRQTSDNSMWTGVKTMLTRLTSKGGLTLTTAIVACGIMILTPAGQVLLDGPGTFGTRGIVEPAPEVVEAEPVARPEDAARPVASAKVELLARKGAEADFAEPLPAAPAPLALESSVGIARSMEENRVISQTADTETFANEDPNGVKIAAEDPVSTFSVDVDTASYSIIRSSIMRGQLPPADAVRIEEMINYFPYRYPAPEHGEPPFRPTVNVFESPWNANTQLVHIGIQGTLPAVENRPPLNLVFLVDTSGSMEDPVKLPLLKQSFRMMLDNLRPEDQVAIVAYAGSSGEVLAPTAASDRQAILDALNNLRAGGSTNGQGGLEQAYSVVEGMSADGEVSRVILATDGDFNVGLSDPRGLEDFIAEKRDSGTYLSVLGFGRGNLQDATMQALAQNGNGTAAYIDTLSEAQKVLVDQLTGALFPIADDVKIQVEFNPAKVAEYRLIGYETRALRRQDFSNDRVDAGELGAGHSVTAIYEVTPVGSPARLSDPLRYGATPADTDSDELGFLRLRYKSPGERSSQLIERPFSANGKADSEAKFASSIAGFGQLLYDDSYLGDWGWDDAIALATANRGDDPFGYRQEAIQLMRLAESLDN